MFAETGSLAPDFEKQGGLVPVIIQEFQTDRQGKVLMLAYANPVAYRLTLETGLAHFWSRSRGKLWKKGEKSGIFLTVKEILLDCDQDTLLYLVTRSGPVCHLGNDDCFANIGQVDHD